MRPMLMSSEGRWDKQGLVFAVLCAVCVCVSVRGEWGGGGGVWGGGGGEGGGGVVER